MESTEISMQPNHETPAQPQDSLGESLDSDLCSGPLHRIPSLGSDTTVESDSADFAANSDTTVSTGTINAHPTANSDTSIMTPPDDPDETLSLDDIFEVTGHLPAPASRSHLPCPFEWDGCDIKYDLVEKKKWKLHSLDHLPDKIPPKVVTCTFPGCREPFCSDDGHLTWERFMDHFAEHYEAELNQLWEALGGFTDANDEAHVLLDITQEIDVNLRQYVTHHGMASKAGMDKDINPNPPSELHRIPLGYMNRMPLEYGGQRRTEVVFGPLVDVEPNLDSRSAGVIQVSRRCESHRRQETTAVRAARTSWSYVRPCYPRPSSSQTRNDISTERIVFRP